MLHDTVTDSKPVLGNPAAKWCYACGRQLEASDFDKDSSHGDGLRTKCAWCRNRYMRNYMRVYRERKKQEKENEHEKQK